MCNFALVGMFTMYVVFVGKNKIDLLTCISEYKNNILKFLKTLLNVLSVVSVTEQKEGLSRHDECHQCSTGSFRCLLIRGFVCII